MSVALIGHGTIKHSETSVECFLVWSVEFHYSRLTLNPKRVNSGSGGTTSDARSLKLQLSV